MEKKKLLPTSKRPADYLIGTCPVCNTIHYSKSITGQLNKTQYTCKNGVWDLKAGVKNGCQGLVIYTLNTK